jgi:hypothetical protein
MGFEGNGSWYIRRAVEDMMQTNGKWQGVPQGALPKTSKTTNTSKSNQNHQNYQKPTNLMEIKGSGGGSDGIGKLGGGAPGEFVCLFVCLFV